MKTLKCSVISTVDDECMSFLVVAYRTEKGLPDDLGTYAMLSGIFMPACFFGNAVGPVLGGILLDYYGYRHATLLMFLIVLAMVCFIQVDALLQLRAGLRRDFMLCPTIYYILPCSFVHCSCCWCLRLSYTTIVYDPSVPQMRIELRTSAL